MTATWTLWCDQRPADQTIPYRWRVSPRPILGLEMQPEWTDKMHLCGMGHADDEWWPLFSHWNGYRRTVDPTLAWRAAAPDETGIFWRGLDLLPSPFTGKPPVVGFHGRWIGAPPYQPKWLSLKSWMVNSNGWESAVKMRDAWNLRPSPGLSPERVAMPDTDKIARAICREKCAFMGEPPCFEVEAETGEKEPWPNPDCDEPGCLEIAAAVAEALGRQG